MKLSLIDQIAIYGFAGLALYAAWTDIRSFTIPNRVVAAIAGLWVSHGAVLVVAGAPLALATDGLAGGVLAFLGGAVLFHFRLVGGGDVKLLAAVALWAGQALLLPLMIVTLIAGGLLAGVLLAIRIRQATMAQGTPGAGGFRAALRTAMRSPAPFGVAIAAGALFIATQLLGRADPIPGGFTAVGL